MISKLAAAIVLAAPLCASAQDLIIGPGQALNRMVDYRFCGFPVKRDADGSISRSAAVLSAYQKRWPCPSTGSIAGACPGWALNHDLPLADGGCDAVFNLSWMPVDTKERRGIKSCASSSGVLCVDRYERKIHATPIQVVK